MKITLILLFTVVFLSGCSKNESDIQEPVLFELEENIVGKWDVSNSTTNPFERDDVIIHSIVFNSDKSFKINYSDGTIEGKYKVDSETELTLENVGKLTNTSISIQSMTSNLSLNNIVEKSLESNGDSDFQEGDCTSFLDCMDGKVFGETSIFKIDLNSEKIESSFIQYDFGPQNPCCHFEGEYFGHYISSYDNLKVDIFEHTLDHVSLYFETNCCDDFIIRYRIDEFGNFVEETLSENNNQYNLNYSREETTQTVLDDLLQEYGGNVVCEPIDESKTFIEKQNGKYWKYSYEDFNWYLKFTDNPDEYITLYHNVNDTKYYDYINSSNNTFGINFVTPPVVDYTQINGTYFEGQGYMWWEEYNYPEFDIRFSLSETNCGQIIYYNDYYNEPDISDTNDSFPNKYVLGFNYFYDNGIELGDDGNIIFEEISQSDFDNEVLQNILPPLYLDSNGVTIKCRDDIDFGFVGEVDGVEYTVVDEDTLKQMINNGDDLSRVCTTKIRNGYRLFISRPDFNGDISKWDVSNVDNMYEMFKGSTFNGDISKWDVSNVFNMDRMFLENFYINQDLSSWNVEKVTNCSWFHLLHPSGVPVWTLPKPNFTNCDPN
ncbi:BspA family leucine-rich repeat surface protein [Polaribacter sp.]|nr:BspA family leucine-rich repeat surface protein [Polaribacter sp.]